MTIEQLRSDPQFEEIEGVFVNVDTGEVIDPEAVPEPEGRPLEERSQDAEAVLKRLTALDGRIVGLTAQRKALISAVETNVGRQLKRVEQVREYVEAANLPFLEALATEVVAKKNEGKPKDKWKKFCEFAFGRLSFKAYAGKIEVADKDKALAWCKEHSPGAISRVVTYSIDLSEIDAETRAKWLSGEEAPPEFFKVEKQSDRLYVNTNVKA